MMSNNILVLSYNISFEAMTNKSIGSASVLGGNCHPVSIGSNLTICAQNMARMIDKIPASENKQNFDFAGMQEASRWDELQKASTSLSKLKSYDSYSGRSQMVTFYDHNKYQLDKSAHSGFAPDRPFQILVFSEIQGSSGVIFINAHCPHHLPDVNGKPNYKDYTFDEFSKVVSKELVNLNLSPQEQAYRIIAIGDFNETQWSRIHSKLEPKAFKPFLPLNINTEIGINTVPFTCCQGDGVWQDSNGNVRKGWRGGDYIFDSKKAADTQVPSVYDYDKLLSDHLPVIAMLPH